MVSGIHIVMNFMNIVVNIGMVKFGDFVSFSIFCCLVLFFILQIVFSMGASVSSIPATISGFVTSVTSIP